MGLAGRKVKQRIGSDPRNLTWADDAVRFGQAYLTKLGWEPSRGLGASGDGRTSHIKVAQKLNLLGIGAGNANEMGDDTVAWKQNREYEMLLKRLNEGLEAEQESDEVQEQEGKIKGEVEERRKRKRQGDVDVNKDGDKEKKKRKKNKKDKKDRKEKEKAASKTKEPGKTDQPIPETTKSSPLSTTSTCMQAPTPRPMAHRARFLRSKQLASRSSTAVAEILGMSASSSSSPGPSSLNATPFPPGSEHQTPVHDAGQELRTANMSVGDYFKEKLAARVLTVRETPIDIRPSQSTSSVTHSTSIPVHADVAIVSRAEEDDLAPRAGLGLGSVYSGSIDADAPLAGLGTKFGISMGTFMSLSLPSTSQGAGLENENLPSVTPETFQSGRGERRKVKRGKKNSMETNKESEKEECKGKDLDKRASTMIGNAAGAAVAGTSDSTEERRQIERGRRKEREKQKKKKEKQEYA